MPSEADRYLAGVPSGQVQPQVLLPPQHFSARRPLSPEQRLMIAVVQDAIDCVEKYRFATDRRGRRLFDQERQWPGAKERRE